ncbi:threonine ammonia-lyase IlvA [Aliamphritea spongicola]|uniref:threonine ammonia-lyase IlvA n=1 Tax=Aliamphritea spongicola TaxID=707589 RepID=UPI00196A9FB2|nr:threonine ammonia-lyase IlvA [Aliamphritea spongicola]MBN3562970.1 threonine ammonia-lyase IlvA [Aliamphritea spongicola]
MTATTYTDTPATRSTPAENFYYPQLEDIVAAARRLETVVSYTPLLHSQNLSDQYGANIFLKREDQQVVRSYKIRGAYNKILSLSEEQQRQGIVCASAGNHAQGVAYACALLGLKGTIFMPVPTPSQKVQQVRKYGKEYVDIRLAGDTFDDAYHQAQAFCEAQQASFVHPFDDPEVIEGQASVGVEILQQLELSGHHADMMIMPVGGGGLASGLSAYFKAQSPDTQLIGVEPEGAASMSTSFVAGSNQTLPDIDTFVDGAAVQRVGENTFRICRQNLQDILTVPEGKVCATMLQLYNQEAIVVEPAGALSIAALDSLKDEIRGKTVVCLISGGNNDIHRTEEIRERALLHEGLKHYFIVNFPQRAGALQEFLAEVLGPGDDITHFEYSKKSNSSKGPALIGIELNHKDNFQSLLQRMNEQRIRYEYLNDKPDLFRFLV